MTKLSVMHRMLFSDFSASVQTSNISTSASISSEVPNNAEGGVFLLFQGVWNL